MKDSIIALAKVLACIIAYGIVCGIADHFFGFGG